MSWEEIAKNLKVNTSKLDENIYGEYYDRVFDLFEEGYGYYTLTYSIDVLKDIIKSKKLRVHTLDVNTLIKDVDINDISESTIISVEPLILVSINHMLQLIVVDGNKRLRDAYLRKDKKIKVYILNSEDTVPAFICDSMVKMYSIHFNINLLVNFLLGTYTEEHYLKNRMDV